MAKPTFGRGLSGVTRDLALQSMHLSSTEQVEELSNSALFLHTDGQPDLELS